MRYILPACFQSRGSPAPGNSHGPPLDPPKQVQISLMLAGPELNDISPNKKIQFLKLYVSIKASFSLLKFRIMKGVNKKFASSMQQEKHKENKPPVLHV